MAKSNKKRDAERRSAAAAKAAELRRQQQAAERRRQGLMVGGTVLTVLVVIALVAVVIFTSKDNDEAAAAKEQPATSIKGFNSDYGITFQQGKPKAHIVVYEDFQCPACRQFQENVGPTLEKLKNKGVVSIEYRMIAFLDAASSTRYSTRSLNAAQCVADESGSKAYLKFHDLLYANQPAEGSAGLPDETLVKLAEQAGAPDAADCIENLKYEGWTLGATRAAADANVTSTPTVLLNGETLDLTKVGTIGNFEKQIYEAAGMKAPADTSSATQSAPSSQSQE